MWRQRANRLFVSFLVVLVLAPTALFLVAVVGPNPVDVVRASLVGVGCLC